MKQISRRAKAVAKAIDRRATGRRIAQFGLAGGLVVAGAWLIQLI